MRKLLEGDNFRPMYQNFGKWLVALRALSRLTASILILILLSLNPSWLPFVSIIYHILWKMSIRLFRRKTSNTNFGKVYLSRYPWSSSQKKLSFSLWFREISSSHFFQNQIAAQIATITRTPQEIGLSINFFLPSQFLYIVYHNFWIMSTIGIRRQLSQLLSSFSQLP